MNTYLLDSLTIRHFRAFRELHIPSLARVNLITGKNNVGKSCLLEALWVYARRGTGSALIQILTSRDEMRGLQQGNENVTEDQALAFKYLYFGRKDTRVPLEPIEIGPGITSEKLLSINIGWYVVKSSESGRRDMLPVNPDEYNAGESPILGLRIQDGDMEPSVQRLDLLLERRLARTLEPKGIPAVLVPANGLDSKQISEFWDSIALTSLEDDVLASLRFIAPEVQRVNLVGDEGYSRNRVPFVKIAHQEAPIPLRSLGEGMNRMFGLALALVNAQNGILLIDEIESGLHYSAYLKVWRLIFKVAHELNIQVVATSHSWDAIEAFQQAANEDSEKGLLIRLSRKGDDILPTLFSEDELAIATRDQIEVR